MLFCRRGTGPANEQGEGTLNANAQIGRETPRACGTCTLCCRLYILPELDKPAGEWCRNCAQGKGCNIYETRPATCRSFQCMWTVVGALGHDWRPDVAGFVIASSDMQIYIDVDPERPSAWRKEPYYSQIKAWSRRDRENFLTVVVRTPTESIVVFPEREIVLGPPKFGYEIRSGYQTQGGRPDPFAFIELSPPKACGGCTLCCKVFDIPELEKPPGVLCRHCDGEGCAIHATRPQVCASFQCAWSLLPDLDARWRPDTAKFLMTMPNHQLVIDCEPGFEEAWRKEPYYTQIKQWSKRGPGAFVGVIVRAGGAVTCVFPEDDIVLEQRPGTTIDTGYEQRDGRTVPYARYAEPREPA